MTSHNTDNQLHQNTPVTQLPTLTAGGKNIEYCCTDQHTNCSHTYNSAIDKWKSCTERMKVETDVEYPDRLFFYDESCYDKISRNNVRLKRQEYKEEKKL